MNSSDVRIVRLIPTTTNGSFSGGGGSFWDANGVLQQAPPNTLRVAYDPSDLSKAPYALIEPEETTNFLTYSEDFTHPHWFKNNVTPVPNSAVAPDGAMGMALIREATGTTAHYLTRAPVFNAGDLITLSVFGKKGVGDRGLALVFTGPIVGTNQIVNFDFDSGLATLTSGRASFSIKKEGDFFRCSISTVALISGNVAIQIRNSKNGLINYEGDGNSGVYVWGAMIQAGPLSSYVRTAGDFATRAADVIGPGAGLVASNVPVTEPLWAAGTTYAVKALVRDAANIVYESLVANNVGNDPTLAANKTKWLNLGTTNRWRAFDKAVNSQTSAPGVLTLSVKPGAVATTMMLLNMEGASVTVSQTDSGYVRTKSLVSHEVDNWYDFYYEDPVRAGDAVFTDIPPFPNAMLTVSIDNGPLESKIGACLIGKPMVIGKATASFKAGVLSYSTSTADTFGNITMVKRYNAPRMNFDVMIPAGSESVVYRILREYTDTEIGIIVGDSLSMGIGYGYLGQWDVPKSGSGRTAPIEFKGLV